jgi:hydrogenase maturation protease
MKHRMLVAGIGNIFLGDDGFGPQVAARLADAGLPGWVRVADYGISGMHLAYDLAEGYDTAVLVDAAPRGGPPGTVYLLQASPGPPPGGPGEHDRAPGAPLLDGHGMQPDVVLGMLALLGAGSQPGAAASPAPPRRVLIVGCEPASTQEGIGLSDPVAAAVDQAVDIVLALVREAGEDRPAHQREEIHVPRYSG